MSIEQIAVIVGAASAGVGVVGVTLLKLFGRKDVRACPVNAGDALDRLAEAVREQTATLREIRDRLVGMGYEQNQTALALGRVETSMQALHRRFDSIERGT